MDSLSISINLSEDILKTLAGFLADALREREIRETRKETKERDEKVTKEESKESVEKSVEIKEKENNSTCIIVDDKDVDVEGNIVCNRGYTPIYVNNNVNNVNKINNNNVIKEIIPPTLREIQDYIASKCYSVNAEKFYKYYTANNWRAKGGDCILDDWRRVVDRWALKVQYGNPSLVKPAERILAPTNFDD